MRSWRDKRLLGWLATWLLFMSWNTTKGQIRYNIPEELKEGSVVGNIVEDLGLDISEISERNLRIASGAGKQYFSVDLGKGELVLNERIDRETLCGQNTACLMPVQVVIENPLQLHRVEIEVQDINDNAPSFHTKESVLNIAESSTPGAKFSLESAEDPDAGNNGLKLYKLNKNDYFKLNVKSLQNGRKIPELVLDKALDREKQCVHHIVLTALDGGDPVRSGTTLIRVNVIDVNDNEPQFNEATYKTSIHENAMNGVVVLTIKATDLDEGLNGEIEYDFGVHTSDGLKKTFFVNPETGEITVVGSLDYEINKSYTFDVRATDKGIPKQEGHTSVQVDILDENDNAPEVILTSLPSPVKEDAPVGTVIALINVHDLDSGKNSEVNVRIPAGYPFELKPSFDNHYSLLTTSPLDREVEAEYNVEIVATDAGTPALKTSKYINVKIVDVNDNCPIFSQTSYAMYVRENNRAGVSLFSVSASDMDQSKNALISYSITDSNFQNIPASSYFYINSENGTLYSMISFDYEKVQRFQLTIEARDQGSPSLTSNITVHVFILDENDNVPAVIYPSAVMGSSQQRMSRTAKPGQLVTKVTAVDADSGHNAWISYALAEATDASLFSVNLYTGEVRTKRAVLEQDDSSQRLLIEMKDNGEPAQSATVTVNILVEDRLHEPMSDFHQKTAESNKRKSKITFYLIISLASVSVLSLLTFFILVVKCVRNSQRNSSCCIRRAESDGYKNPNRNLQIQLNTDGPIKYVEVLGGDMLSQSQSFRSCMSPMSEFSEFTLVKPSSTTDFKDMINVLDASLPDSAWTFESQQQQAPNDWHVSQNQRPGPSGTYRYHTTTQQRWTPYGKARAGPHPGEGGMVAGTGPWPNPPTEAEQLQALMAAANVSEATATLGPRYNAQFPMQHVPDYRQNVYIPGSTATLTAHPQQVPQQAMASAQAMPQVDVSAAAETPMNKKKSTKKDKK